MLKIKTTFNLSTRPLKNKKRAESLYSISSSSILAASSMLFLLVLPLTLKNGQTIV